MYLTPPFLGGLCTTTSKPQKSPSFSFLIQQMDFLPLGNYLEVKEWKKKKKKDPISDNASIF